MLKISYEYWKCWNCKAENHNDFFDCWQCHKPKKRPEFIKEKPEFPREQSK